MMRGLLIWLDPRGQGFWRVRVTVLAWISIAAGTFIIFWERAPMRRFLPPLWCGWLMPVFAVLYLLLLRLRRPKTADACLFCLGVCFLGRGASTAGFGCFVMAYSCYCFYYHLRKAQPALLA